MGSSQKLQSLCPSAENRVPNEKYFIYYEDPDWCFRVRNAGYRIVSSIRARVYHKASSSLGGGSAFFYYYRARNYLRFIRRNARKNFWRLFARYLFVSFPGTFATHKVSVPAMDGHPAAEPPLEGSYEIPVEPRMVERPV